VTVIDGGTNATSTVAVGPISHGIVVNPVTNKIYEIDNSANVTVIDGATNATSTVALPAAEPNDIAVNPVTNTIYVTELSGTTSTLTIIDGATNTTTTVNPGNGTSEGGLGINPATNRIYVANYGTMPSDTNGNTVTVFDGSTNSVIATVPTGNNPQGLAVNPVTNKIYVTNFNSNFITVIDGATNAATNIAIPSTPGTLGYGYFVIAVNPVMNKIYISGLDGVAMVIDGATNLVTPLDLPGFPNSIVVNSATNKIYIPTNISNSAGGVTVLDGVTDDIITTVNAGNGPIGVAVNPVTNQVYVANYGTVETNYNGNTVTVITEAQVQTVPLSVSITSLAENQTSSATPSFTFTAQSTFSPTAPPPQDVFFQVDICQGPWTQAASQGSSFTGATPSIQPGFHILYAYAVDGQDGTSVQADSPLVSAIAAYCFLVLPPPPGFPNIMTEPASQTVNMGQSVAFSVVATGTPKPTYQWFFNGAALTDGAGISGSSTSTLYLSGTSAYAGNYTCTATNSVGSLSTSGANLTVLNTSTPGRLIDISARAFVGTGGNVLIAGYVIQGSAPLPVLIRSSGPALIPLNVTGVLPDPKLQLYSGSTLIYSDAGWGGNAAIAAAASNVGAFSWTNPSSDDSALLETQNSGPYTAITSGVSGDTGVALAEVYDATPSGTWNSSLPRLGNISSRAFVGTGGNVLISGFVIGGSTAKTVLIRASGPALTPLGVTGVLPDPQLQLYSGNTVIYSNAGWGGNAAIAAAASSLGAFAWTNPSSNDSAILVTLSPGAYTAIISGVSGDTGVALAEIYDVP
jgi:YVTN family beta-propeller protein